MDNPRDEPPIPSQAELEAMFEAEEAEIAKGGTVPLEPLLARLRATAARLRQERADTEAITNRAP